MANEKPANPAPKSDIQIMAEALGEAIRANRPKSAYGEAGFTPEQEARLAELPKPQRHRKVACKSEDTGATFIACVVESKTHKHGRIVSLENYTHPPGILTYKAQGGLVPDGQRILRAGTSAPAEGAQIPKHDFDIYYLQWRWTEFYQQDLRRYAGKPLLPSHAIDQDAFTTPWQEGTVGNLAEVA